KFIVIKFSASWCSPCNFMAPLFHELAAEMPDLAFVDIDVDGVAAIAASYKIEAMPTFLVLFDLEVKERFTGANINGVREMIKKAASKAPEEERDV
ncbi:unnamed protein product, partial [Polarella glacialis]